MRTVYLGCVTVPDGYRGGEVALHLCREPGGRVLAVYVHGYVVFDDPAQGLAPPPTLTPLTGPAVGLYHVEAYPDGDGWGCQWIRDDNLVGLYRWEPARWEVELEVLADFAATALHPTEGWAQ